MVESSNLAPGLLLAMPQLADPNFSRAVVLMIEHSEQGSFGLVINHPVPIKASELLDSLEMSWRGEDSAVVWAGGPVSPAPAGCCTSRSAIAEPGAGARSRSPRASRCRRRPIGCARSRAAAAQHPAPARLLRLGPRPARAGDGARRVAAHRRRSGLVFETPPDEIWETAMQSLGINPRDLFVGRGVN